MKLLSKTFGDQLHKSNVFVENQGRTKRTRSKIESSVPKIAKEKGRPG